MSYMNNLIFQNHTIPLLFKYIVIRKHLASDEHNREILNKLAVDYLVKIIHLR